MHLTRPRRTMPTVNISALIDIAFILVIFVVLAANFQRIHNVDVELPQASSETTANPKSLVVTVPKSGPLDVGGQTVTPAHIPQTLRRMKDRFDALLIVADRQSSVQRAIRVLSDAQLVGFKSVAIATQRGGR